jgi:hypothetical protein
MNDAISNELLAEKLSFEAFRQEVLKDYRLACESREVSLMGRKEVLTGKAKFGIFGDGKEVPQVAMAKFFKPGISTAVIIASNSSLLRRYRPQSPNFLRSFMLIRTLPMIPIAAAGR